MQFHSILYLYRYISVEPTHRIVLVPKHHTMNGRGDEFPSIINLGCSWRCGELLAPVVLLYENSLQYEL
jgi:hypothetical protein